MISQKKFDNINKYWLNLYDNYQLTLDSNLKNDSIEWRLKNIRGFLKYLTEFNIKCNNLFPTNIYDYLSSLENYSPRTREHRAVCIRFFLDYLYNQNLISFKGTNILPKIRCNKDSKIISYYSDNEINKLLSVINTNLNNGKLDFAIISMLVYFGLRSKDIINLKIEDFDWKNNSLTIIQSKNNYINSLPLIDEIKYPVLDYLKNERVSNDSEFLFIKQNNKRITDHYIYNMLNKYFKLANIDTNYKRHGAHSLRHSLGTSLINNGENIYTISKILGHFNVDDTKTYLKLDFNNLKKISLEVPTWEI